MGPRQTLIGLSLGLLAACARTGQIDGERAGPNYGPREVYRLSFQGVRLGMDYVAACERLFALGYVRHPSDTAEGCSREAVADGGDGFFGGSFSQPGTVARTVKFFTLRTSQGRGRPVLTGIDVHSDEPGRQNALVEMMRDEWGEPTAFAAPTYARLTYASSRAQANWYHRANHMSCLVRPQCYEKLDCGAILRRFSTAVAEVAIYDWGRWIRISDHRATLEKMRRSGELARIDRGPKLVCLAPPIH